MKIYFGDDKIEYPLPAIALGNFDGMHRGHLKIFERAKAEGENYGVLLFEKHTSSLTGNSVEVITPLYEKLYVLSKIGVDFVYLVSFDKRFMNMSLEEFAEYLYNIGAKVISVGYDYRCAKNASSGAEDLKNCLEKYDIRTVISEAVFYDGELVKSSRIRELIKQGNILEANALMNRPFRVSGIVVYGFQNGRKMGFPTANIDSEPGMLLPAEGVYYGETCIDDVKYRAVVNVGHNPTFNAEKKTVEAHIIGYDNDLYGQRISVDFYEKIRSDMKFNSIKELASQISKDCEYAKNREEREDNYGI